MDNFDSDAFADILYAVSTQPEVLKLPMEAAFIAQWLEGATPMTPPGYSTDNATSAEIVAALEEIVPLTLQTVARTMHALGFRIYSADGHSPKWAIVRTKKNQSTI